MTRSEEQLTNAGCGAIFGLVLLVGLLGSLAHVLIDPTEEELMQTCAEVCGGHMSRWERRDHTCVCAP